LRLLWPVLLLPSLLALAPAGKVERKIEVVPTGVDEPAELRINTGRKARLADGSTNTVYLKKTPGKGMTFLRFKVELAVDGEPLDLRAQDLRLESGGDAPRVYAPVDWFQDLGLVESRGDSLEVADRALLEFTFEVPPEHMEELTLVVASLPMGTVAQIRDRIREQSGLK
jgi:hypothetical protein